MRKISRKRSKRCENKAVYTTASVTYGWAGAVMQVKPPVGVFSHCVTNRPTDLQNDRMTKKR